MRLHVVANCISAGGIALAATSVAMFSGSGPYWSSAPLNFDRWVSYGASWDSYSRFSFDTGLALLLLGCSLSALAWMLGLDRNHSVWGLRTPKRKANLFLAANFMWLGWWLSESLWLFIDTLRHLPGWAVFIGIPLYELSIAALIALPIVNLAFAFLVWNSKPSTPMWIRPTNKMSWAVTVVTGAVLVFLTLYLLAVTFFGNWFSIPFIVTALYVVVCGRAAFESKVPVKVTVQTETAAAPAK